MKKITQTLVFCFLAFSSYCQNWQVIPLGLDSITLTDDSIYYTATIDSVYSTPSEMSWVLNKKMLQFTSRLPNCDADLFQSAMGYKISQSNARINFYYYSDTFSFSLNSLSYCVFKQDSLTITPLAITIDTLFNGQIDSIKSYSISASGKSGFFNPALSYRLQLSKNYGLIEFPHIFNSAQLDIRGANQVNAIKRIETDYPSKKSIFYNFDVNSQFHKREVWTSNGFRVTEILSNHVILSKTSTTQAFTYRLLRKMLKTEYSYFPYKDSSTVMQDTVTVVINNINQPLFSQLTDFQFDSDTNYSKFVAVKKNQSNLWEITRYEGDLAFFPIPCARSYLDLKWTETTYSECFGEKYYYSADCESGLCQTQERELLYAQNGSCTFGIPNAISTKEHNLSQHDFFPNPVSDELYFPSPILESKEWIIGDFSGKIVAKGVLSKGDSSVDLSPLKSGMYWVKIADYQVIKIIKK